MKAGIPRFIRHFPSRRRRFSIAIRENVFRRAGADLVSGPRHSQAQPRQLSVPAGGLPHRLRFCRLAVWGRWRSGCGLKRLARGRLAAYCGMMTVWRCSLDAHFLHRRGHGGQRPPRAIKRTREGPGRLRFPAATPNTPVGVARGIHPGRVVWARDPSATKWAGNWQQKSDQWWLDENTDQARVDVCWPPL